MKHNKKNLLFAGTAILILAIGAASYAYYRSATGRPAYTYSTIATGAISEQVQASGEVNPAQNPDLSFQLGGRVVRVNAAVGAKVSAGSILAELDNADLQSQLRQAQANVKAQQAKLDGLKAGPRDVDLQVKQTALQQAQQSLANLYAGVPDALMSAFSASYDAVHSQTDDLFSNPNSAPQIVFNTHNIQAENNIGQQRTLANQELAVWKTEVSAASAGDPAALEAEIDSSSAHLAVVRSYLNDLADLLLDVIPDQSFSQASLSAATAAVSGARASVNQTATTIDTLRQSVQAQKLAVKSAQDQLTQLQAGSTPQDIEAQEAALEAAQASADTIEAQIAKTLIIAPFSGTIAQVDIKAGQIAAANASVISLVPDKAFEIDAYVGETDVTKVHVSDPASVTLDAYGAGRIFPATVVSADQSPTQVNNVPSYKVAIQFNNEDPDIRAGMTANATIVTAHKDAVLLAPRSAVVHKGGQAFVLLKTPGGTAETQVQTGIEGSSTVEIVSGVTEGQQVATFGQ